MPTPLPADGRRQRTRGTKPSAEPPTAAAWLLTDVITRLRRVLRQSIRSDYPWETLPMAQVEILQRLADEPGLRINDLAARHRLANNTVSTLIQQMVLAGLVTRDADPSDRRAVQLHLTGDGEQMLADWLQAHEERFAAALGQLPPSDRAAVLAALPALSRLAAGMEQADIKRR